MKILYEDDAVIVVVKEAGVAVQSANIGRMDLVSELRNHIHSPYIGVVHRLDQPVEGIMVFAKTSVAAAELSKQVRDHLLNKRYDALVTLEGEDIPVKGTLRDHVIFDRRNNRSFVTEASAPGAKEALLDYEIKEILRGHENRGAHVEIDLHTGRHHQIRLQLSHAKMPIIGDRKYNDAKKPRNGGLCLAASGLVFIHPGSHTRMEYHTEPGFLKKKETIIADL